MLKKTEVLEDIKEHYLKKIGYYEAESEEDRVEKIIMGIDVLLFVLCTSICSITEKEQFLEDILGEIRVRHRSASKIREKIISRKSNDNKQVM